MPQLGESVAEGTIGKWLVKEGDSVSREQPLALIETDKANTEVLATAAGVVARLAAPEGTVVPVRGLLCVIDESASAPAPVKETPAPVKEAPPAATVAEPKPLSSPSTRRLAHEMGVDLRAVAPTGEYGRVTRDDVVRAGTASEASPPAAAAAAAPAPASAAAPAAAPAPAATPAATELSQMIQAGGGFVPPIPGVGFGAYKVPPYTPKPGDEVIPFSRLRRITADHMVYSKAVSPHVVAVAEVDLHATSKLRDQHKDALKKAGISLTFLSFICAATVKALRENPDVNARVLDASYVKLRDINLGVAVDTPRGLVVPSIKHADRLSLSGMAAAIDDLAARARAGKLGPDDLAGTTFSVSNPGLKGNLFGGAIISQPNVGILRMGEIKKRPVVVTKDGEDAIAIHPVMFLAFSYDHRVIDGVAANSFLWRVSDLLSRGEFSL